MWASARSLPGGLIRGLYGTADVWNTSSAQVRCCRRQKQARTAHRRVDSSDGVMGFTGRKTGFQQRRAPVVALELLSFQYLRLV